MPLPAARRPDIIRRLRLCIGQLHGFGAQAANTKPLVIKSKLCGICRSETASQWGMAPIFF